MQGAVGSEYSKETFGKFEFVQVARIGVGLADGVVVVVWVGLRLGLRLGLLGLLGLFG